MRLSFVLIAALLCWLPGCGGKPAPGPAPREGPPVIYTVNHPLAWMARQMLPEDFEVVCPVPTGRDPAYWLPGDAHIAAFQKADLILLNGAEYAKWVPRATLPRARLVDTSAGFASTYLETKGVSHSHGPEGDHSHTGVAGTTWLDLKQAGQQATAIVGAFLEHFQTLPGKAQRDMKAAWSQLLDQLETLDGELESIASAARDKRLLSNHPVYPYFARRYGFEIESVHWDPATMPPKPAWAALRKTLARHPAKIMLWEAEPLPEIAKELEALGVRSVLFDPCAAPPAEGDFLTVMKANIARLRAALEAE